MIRVHVHDRGGHRVLDAGAQGSTGTQGTAYGGTPRRAPRPAKPPGVRAGGFTVDEPPGGAAQPQQGTTHQIAAQMHEAAAQEAQGKNYGAQNPVSRAHTEAAKAHKAAHGLLGKPGYTQAAHWANSSTAHARRLSNPPGQDASPPAPQPAVRTQGQQGPDIKAGSNTPQPRPQPPPQPYRGYDYGTAEGARKRGQGVGRPGAPGYSNPARTAFAAQRPAIASQTSQSGSSGYGTEERRRDAARLAHLQQASANPFAGRQHEAEMNQIRARMRQGDEAPYNWATGNPPLRDAHTIDEWFAGDAASPKAPGTPKPPAPPKPKAPPKPPAPKAAPTSPPPKPPKPPVPPTPKPKQPGQPFGAKVAAAPGTLVQAAAAPVRGVGRAVSGLNRLAAWGEHLSNDSVGSWFDSGTALGAKRGQSTKRHLAAEDEAKKRRNWSSHRSIDAWFDDAEWKEEEHTRGGNPKNPGQFSKGGGGGAGGESETETKERPESEKPTGLSDLPPAERQRMLQRTEQRGEREGLRQPGKTARHASGLAKGRRSKANITPPSPEVQREAAKSVRGWNKMLAQMQGGEGPAALLDQHGRHFLADADTYAGPRGRLHQCYQNAGMEALFNPDVVYCEGKVTCYGVPIDHAWLVDKASGKVIDPTIREAVGIGAYVGIPFKTDYLSKTLSRCKVWGIFHHLNDQIYDDDPDDYVESAACKFGDAACPPSKAPTEKPPKPTKESSPAFHLYDNQGEIPSSEQFKEKYCSEGDIAAMERDNKRMKEGIATDKPVFRGGFRLWENGPWTDAREEKHDDIVYKDIFTTARMLACRPKKGEKPQVYVIGGRGGSGKSYFTQGRKGAPEGHYVAAEKPMLDQNTAILLDSDMIKEQLPGYEPPLAGLFHEESSHVYERAVKYARDMGLNVILDATLKSPGGARQKIAAFKAAGYEINMHYMFAPAWKAAENAVKRYRGKKGDHKGRYVPPEYVLGSTTNEQTFDGLRDYADHWTVHDNTDTSRPEGPLLYAEGHGAKKEFTDDELREALAVDPMRYEKKPLAA